MGVSGIYLLDMPITRGALRRGIGHSVEGTSVLVRTVQYGAVLEDGYHGSVCWCIFQVLSYTDWALSDEYEGSQRAKERYSRALLAIL